MSVSHAAELTCSFVARISLPFEHRFVVASHTEPAAEDIPSCVVPESRSTKTGLPLPAAAATMFCVWTL